MVRKMRVQSHSFANDTQVSIGFSALEGSFSANGNITKDEAVDLPVGTVVTITIEPAE